MKVLYIAGYSRSGSTLLDIALGSHPAVFGAGEVAFLPEDWDNPNRVCTCGRIYPECAVWGGLYSSPDEAARAAETARAIESAAGLRRLLNDEIPQVEGVAYRALVERTLAHVAAHAKASVFVDSSKSARFTVGRPDALQRLAGLDVHVLHLVRSPEATVGAYIGTGSNWAMEGAGSGHRLRGLRAALGWRIAHERVLRLAKGLPPERYLRMRFEDFLAAPADWTARIGRFLEIDLTGLADALEGGVPIRPQHQVGGNRLRLAEEITLRPGAARSRLSFPRRLAVRLATGRTARDLGYQSGE